MAAIPIFVLLIMIGVLRKPAWLSALAGLGAAMLVSFFAYGMPASLTFSSIGYGAAQGLFPIGWVVFSAILLYNIVVKTGKFEIVKDSMGNLTGDRRMQALLIAFAFGAFIEGAAGFGTSVAVAAAMLTGLGFEPFYAAGICLLANTVPVTFGSLGIPITTLAENHRAAARSPQQRRGPHLFSGRRHRAGLPGPHDGRLEGAARRSGRRCFAASFSAAFSSGRHLSGPGTGRAAGRHRHPGHPGADTKVWKPKDKYQMEGDGPARPMTSIPAGEALLAWSPFILLVTCVLISGLVNKHTTLMSRFSISFPWPSLHNLAVRMAPVVAKPTPYAAHFPFDWLSAAGTSVLIAAMLSAMVLRMSVGTFFGVLKATA